MHGPPPCFSPPCALSLWAPFTLFSEAHMLGSTWGAGSRPAAGSRERPLPLLIGPRPPQPRQGTYGQGQEFFPNQVQQAFPTFFLFAQTCPSADSSCHTRSTSACPGHTWGSKAQEHRVCILQPRGISLSLTFQLLLVPGPEHKLVRGGPLPLIPT